MRSVDGHDVSGHQLQLLNQFDRFRLDIRSATWMNARIVIEREAAAEFDFLDHDMSLIGLDLHDPGGFLVLPPQVQFGSDDGARNEFGRGKFLVKHAALRVATANRVQTERDDGIGQDVNARKYHVSRRQKRVEMALFDVDHWDEGHNADADRAGDPDHRARQRLVQIADVGVDGDRELRVDPARDANHSANVAQCSAHEQPARRVHEGKNPELIFAHQELEEIRIGDKDGQQHVWEA